MFGEMIISERTKVRIMAEKQKKKNTFGKALSNNIYMVKLTYQACPSRVLGIFLTTWIKYGLLHMFLRVIFIEKVVGFIEEDASYRDAVVFVLFSIVFLGICKLVCAYYDKLIAPAGNQLLYEKLHLRMFQKATEVELECFENPKFYNKYTKASSQIKGRAFAVLNIMSDMVCILLNISFLTYKSIATDPFVLILTVLPVISTYMIGIKTNKLQYKRYEEGVPYDRKKEYVKRTVYLQDYAKEIRLSNIFHVLMDYLNTAVEGSIRNIKKYGFRLVLLHSLQNSLMYSLTVGCTICYAALRLLYWHNISAADFIILVNIISAFIWNIRDIAKNLAKLQNNSLYIDNIKEFMEYEPKISENQDGLLPERHRSTLRMKDVYYTYFGQEKPTLKNINLEIKPGEKIALVGHNGAGKSTLVKLLMRLYDVTSGEITLGDHNIKDYRVQAYRDLFGTAFQDYKVLSLSVAENVLMRDVKEKDRPAVIKALKESGVYEKIKTLPKGIDTTLTKEFDPEGAVLSGGETQKIAVARVFARDCDFAILDEPSSALDPIAEYQMYESMLQACKSKSVVFISHRLSSAVLADRIYMLENGEVIEHGTHQELMKLGGKYAAMFEMQAKSYR